MWSRLLLLFTACVALGGGVFLLPPGEPLIYKAGEFVTADTAFQPSIAVSNRTVSCAAGAIYNNSYPGRMYTCKNISVDGIRIAYSLMGKGSDQHVCGSEKGSNSLYWLCVALLNSTDTVYGKLSAAYVTEAHCDGQLGGRVRFVHRGTSSTWDYDNSSPAGYMLALQCLTDENTVYDYA